MEKHRSKNDKTVKTIYMKTIFAIFSHPDDCELWAGGILKKHIDMGDEVKIFFFHQLTDKRIEESKTALAILGLTPTFVNTPDYQMPDFENFVLTAGDKNPDIVISHWEEDTHLEHRLIFEHSLKYVHYLKRYKKNTPIFLVASTYYLMGRQQNFRPSLIFDISPYIELKENAINCHISQKPHSLLKDIISQNQIFGKQVGVEYAEGFIEYPLFGFNRTALRDNLRDLL